MKIKCSCNYLIVDSTDNLRHKGHLISNTQYFDFWDAIDEAIEESGDSPKEKEIAAMELRRKNLFKLVYECQNCGKLYFDGKDGELISYTPDNSTYNKVLDKKE
ncbi:MAG: hypothetical protein MI810_21305 [Flavobacteriales bacterium]|jgi:hypothetical protein|nr:hypothetical protein [Flavobacteriales bacterium]